MLRPRSPNVPLDKLDKSRHLATLVWLDEREPMPARDKQSSLVQGTLHMLILKTLTLEPLHGYGIGVRLEQISNGGFHVNAGSLFPALRRLERDGLIRGEWRVTENNRRAKYYRLTPHGRARLERGA